MTNRQASRKWGAGVLLAIATFFAATTAQQQTKPIEVTVAGVDGRR